MIANAFLGAFRNPYGMWALCCWRVQVFCQAENAAEKKSVLKGAPHFCSCCARQRQKLKPEITIDSEKIMFLDRWGLRTASSLPANVFSLIRLKTSTPKVRRSQRNGRCQPANESGQGPKICCYRSQTRFSQTIERVWFVYAL